MAKLKVIKVTPLRKLDFKKDIKSTKKKHYDFTSLNNEQTNKLFMDLNRFLKKVKSRGIIITKKIEDKQFVSLTLNSAANRKNILSFPEPDPVKLNFINANKNLEQAITFKNKLLQVKTSNSAEQFNLFLEYYQTASTGVVFLIASIEAFMNQWIPFGKTIKIDDLVKNKKELEYLDFNTKITKLLPILTGKNFSKDFHNKYNIISTCNAIRDDIIHLKTELNPNKTTYENIYKRLFDLPIKTASDSTFDLINYYYEDYLEEEITQSND